MYYIGIDPGQSGGVGVLNATGDYMNSFKFKDITIADIAEIFEYIVGLEGGTFAIIESVHSMPKQGVSSSFKFGRSYGNLEMALAAFKIPFDYVSPQRWQKYLQCQTKGNKNITKSLAQRLWPVQKITHAIADALLLAEYARRIKR